MLGSGPAGRLGFMDPNVVRQKSFYFVCHFGLDPKSSVSDLDSRWSLSRLKTGTGMTASELM